MKNDSYDDLKKTINNNEKYFNKQIEDLKKSNQSIKDDLQKKINFTENKITTFINSYNKDKTNIKNEIYNLDNMIKKKSDSKNSINKI